MLCGDYVIHGYRYFHPLLTAEFPSISTIVHTTRPLLQLEMHWGVLDDAGDVGDLLMQEN
jgi:hypothetical protein